MTNLYFTQQFRQLRATSQVLDIRSACGRRLKSANTDVTFGQQFSVGRPWVGNLCNWNNRYYPRWRAYEWSCGVDFGSTETYKVLPQAVSAQSTALTAKSGRLSVVAGSANTALSLARECLGSHSIQLHVAEALPYIARGVISEYSSNVRLH